MASHPTVMLRLWVPGGTSGVTLTPVPAVVMTVLTTVRFGVALFRAATRVGRANRDSFFRTDRRVSFPRWTLARYPGAASRGRRRCRGTAQDASRWKAKRDEARDSSLASAAVNPWGLITSP